MNTFCVDTSNEHFDYDDDYGIFINGWSKLLTLLGCYHFPLHFTFQSSSSSL